MGRISLPKWIVPLVLVLGFLGALIFPAAILADAAPPELRQGSFFLSILIIIMAWFLAASSYWLGLVLNEGRVRGLPLSLIQEGSFPVLLAQARAVNKDNIWYFLIEAEKGLRFVSYPHEIVTQEISTAEKGRLEIKRRADVTKITYFHPH